MYLMTELCIGIIWIGIVLTVLGLELFTDHRKIIRYRSNKENNGNNCILKR
jgi:hypothetical protein